MLLSKPQDIFQLKPGDVVTKRNLSDLIQFSKVEGSEYWAGRDYRIGNTPQQGINWIGGLSDVKAVIIKTKSGAYDHDGWADEKMLTYQYSFKARKGAVSYEDTANQVLISQPDLHYPIFLLTEKKDSWYMEGRFSVIDRKDAFVVLHREDATSSGVMAGKNPGGDESSRCWSSQELRAAGEAYVEMHRLDSAGTSFSKRPYYTDLAARFGRTEKAYEYRMQNISYIFELQGRRWVKGLLPARNVGRNVIETLEALLVDVEGWKLGQSAGFSAQVGRMIRESQPAEPPAGNEHPESVASNASQFVRDPAVVAWVLKAAKGVCECCRSRAPFSREDGSDYLEVHHVVRLVDGGADTISNAVAVCPNCHRELHYGKQMDLLVSKLQYAVERLSGPLRE